MSSEAVEPRRMTAFHEAGHAVFTLRNDFELIEASIVPVEGRSHGHCYWSGIRAGFAGIEVLAAGPETVECFAESEQFQIDDTWLIENDHAEIMQFAQQLVSDGDFDTLR